MRALWILGETLRGLIEWLIAPMPGPAGYAIRWLYYKLILRRLGWGTLIDVGVRIEHPRSVSIGSRCWIDRHVLIIGAVQDPLKGRPGKWVRRDPKVEDRVTIGDGTHIGPNCILSGLAGLAVGSHLTLATGTAVYSLSHHYRSLETGFPTSFTPRAPTGDQFMIAGPVEIADGTGTGIHAIVLPGSYLAPGSFLTLGSVLQGGTRPGWIYTGNPAVPTKKRGAD